MSHHIGLPRTKHGSPSGYPGLSMAHYICFLRAKHGAPYLFTKGQHGTPYVVTEGREGPAEVGIARIFWASDTQITCDVACGATFLYEFARLTVLINFLISLYYTMRVCPFICFHHWALFEHSVIQYTKICLICLGGCLYQTLYEHSLRGGHICKYISGYYKASMVHHGTWYIQLRSAEHDTTYLVAKGQHGAPYLVIMGWGRHTMFGY